MALHLNKYQRHKTLEPLLTAVMLILPLCCACASNPMPASSASEPLSPPQALPKVIPKTDRPRTVEQQLRKVVAHWIGTPHRMGGKDRNGIDCSGFVQRVYLDVFNIRLPRSTALQVRTGTQVGPTTLSAGDLVFFHPPDKIRHVGIYLGRGEFAHASATQGVTISSLHRSYWRDAYWTSRRILPN